MKFPRRHDEGTAGVDAAVWHFAAAASVLLVWMGASIYFVLPPNVISSEGPVFKGLQQTFTTVSPQGWGFFTNAPQTGEISVYDVKSHQSLMLTPQGRVENLFGISRAQRAQGPELAQLADAATGWQECQLGQTREQCLDQASRLMPQPVSIELAHQSLCGPVILTTETFTPFEYRDFDLPIHTIETYSSLDVAC